MDVSPLPHKAPYFSPLEVDSPSPVRSGDVDDEDEDEEMSIEIDQSPAVRYSVVDPARYAFAEYV